MVDPRAVQLTSGQRALSVEPAAAAGLLQFEDGGRTLLGADGWHIEVDPRLWRDGARAVTLLDQLVPATHQIPHTRGSAPPIQLLGPLRRWWGGLRRLPKGRFGFWASISFLVALVLVGLAAQRFFLVIVGVFWLAWAAREAANEPAEKQLPPNLREG